MVLYAVYLYRLQEECGCDSAACQIQVISCKGEGLPQLPLLIHIPNSAYVETVPFSFRLWDPENMMVDVAKKESIEYMRIYKTDVPCPSPGAAGMSRP